MVLSGDQPKVVVEDHSTATDSHISLLQAHLPKSFALLRRLQFAQRAPSPTSHVLIATSRGDGGETGHHFAAAYVDVFKAPETQVWLYSTLEDSVPDDDSDDGTVTATAALPDGPDVDRCVEQVLAMLRRVRDISREAEADNAGPPVGIDGVGRPDSFMVGALDETVRRLLLERGVRTLYRNPHYKFLFRVGDLPTPSGLRPLAADMRWDAIGKEDVPLIISRTNIPKTESTLMTLPSLGIRLSDGTLVAWSFLGVDGTLSTLHCEEPFRGRGLAKAMATKLIKDHNEGFGNDGFCAADVHISNAQSQAVCRSIGGRKGWRVSWSIIANASL
ncbi:hypothetical protein MAPG_06754 [Magnaporthiopsis poae ATCC 64411]|uniref:GCN5-related N-acetyltransferase Rv2170-like domain-containing protein n=1 Tax=Magnaporthiopsis poae (strain ATCC 64411 / 73-15) TaxID=644358 RepID=A0A0C4E2W2_MAGP6|nr:hypothetical protein MAPG_06754 [Magnaporthiopsis poae ATCC 64411]